MVYITPTGTKLTGTELASTKRRLNRRAAQEGKAARFYLDFAAGIVVGRYRGNVDNEIAQAVKYATFAAHAANVRLTLDGLKPVKREL